MIKNRNEALSVLGLKADADAAAIKQSYKELAKKYHPDSSTPDESAIRMINEAYDYLQTAPVNTGKILGHQSHYSRYQSSSKDEYERFQKKYEKRQQEKKQEFKKKQAEFAAKEAKAEEDYQRVMKAVDAIRTARAIEAIIRANDGSKK